MLHRWPTLARLVIPWSLVLVVAVTGALLAWAQDPGPPALPINSGECWDLDSNGNPIPVTMQYLIDQVCDQDVQNCIDGQDPYACQLAPPIRCGNDCRYWLPQGHIYKHGQCRDTANLEVRCPFCLESYFVCASGWKYVDSMCKTYCDPACYRWRWVRERCEAGIQP